jgi:hypothetical protein
MPRPGSPLANGAAIGTGTMPMLSVLAMPMGWIFEPTSPAWRAAANSRNYYFLSRWAWYEWLGAVGPVFILLWFASLARSREQCETAPLKPNAGLSGPPGPSNAQPVGNLALGRLATRTAMYGAFQFGVGLLLALPPSLERLRPMQPMRYLHLVYVLMILLGGCFLGEKLLVRHRWRWVALFVPAALGMFLGQRALYPASPHLELPGVHSSNPWLASFEWIRNHTPEDAYFALGPEYMHRPGEDSHGFRALALRSALADNVKDSAVVTQVPRLAARWQREVAAQNADGDWQHISADGLRRLKAQFGVNWVILERPAALALDCPYRNERLEVCRID